MAGIVFDPGFGTCDDYLVDHGSVVDENTFPDFGMREVFSRTCKKIQDTYGVSLQIPDLQNLLETGEIRILDRKHMKRSNESFRTLLEDASREVCNETIEKFMNYVGNNYEKQKPDVIEIYEKLKNSRN